ncbi:MAG: SDR family NAD(P)-dependent oxidoreductase, partial [Burkholderiales bacterium]
ARDPASVTLAGVIPVKLDVTSDADVDAAARQCSDVTLVINNAGIAATGGVMQADAMESAQRHMNTNYFGLMRVSRAFAPVLAANGGGALLNVLSIASWFQRPMLGLYASTKSAAWAVTNVLRHELREQKTQVIGLHVGFIDTDLTKGFEVQKTSAVEVARISLDGVEAGLEEILVDEVTKQVKGSLSSATPAYLAPL